MAVGAMAIGAAALQAMGCSASPSTPVPGLPRGTVVLPVTEIRRAPLPVTEPSAILRETTLGPDVGVPTGIAIEPESRRRLVLDRDGTVSDLVTGETVWQATLGAAEPFGYTDLLAPSVDQLAITAASDGYLVDLPTASMAPHFCYEPEGWGELPNDPVQVSGCVAIDGAGARLYAQPRSIENGGLGAVTGSFLAAYDAGGGDDVAWWSLPDTSFAATGLAVLPAASGDDVRLLLASGTSLFVFDVAAAELTPTTELGELGVESIAGLALDARQGTLLVLDDARRAVIELRLSALGFE